jgi:hypothetical protein
MFPFTVFHVAAKITRRYTLYTKSPTERNKWKFALESAIEARKSQQVTRMVIFFHLIFQPSHERMNVVIRTPSSQR